MQTAFCEIVFYLNKQPHGHKLQTKMRSGLFSIHFTSQGEYANIVCVMWWWWWRGGGLKGEIGLKAAWGEMLTMRQRQEEEDGGRTVEGSLTKQAEKRWLPQAECHPAHRYLKEREKPLRYPPLTTHKGLHHLFNTPPNPSNTINRFLLRCKEKDCSGGTTKSKKNSPPIQI